MSSREADLRFDSVLGGRSTEKRTALVVFPVVVVLLALLILAGVSISRTSGLQTQLRIAQQQLVEANKVVDDRDRQLREARGETAALATPGQGAGVLKATAAAQGASGIVLDHPAEHALAVYAFNLMPADAGQEYRLVVTDGVGRESLLGALALDARGAAFLLARDVPEGIDRVEVALVPKAAAPKTAGPPANGTASPAATAPAERKPVLTGALPKPGEAGVVAAAETPRESTPHAQGRSATGRRTRAQE